MAKKPTAQKPIPAKQTAKKQKLVPRAGPPTNLRPGGPHADDPEKDRDVAIRKALRRMDIDDDAL